MPKKRGDLFEPFSIEPKNINKRRPFHIKAQLTPKGVLVLHRFDPKLGKSVPTAAALREHERSEIEKSLKRSDIDLKLANTKTPIGLSFRALVEGNDITNSEIDSNFLSTLAKGTITDVDRYKVVRDYILSRKKNDLRGEPKSDILILFAEFKQLSQPLSLSIAQDQASVDRVNLLRKLLAADIVLKWASSKDQDYRKMMWLGVEIQRSHRIGDKTVEDIIQGEFLKGVHANYYTSDEKQIVRDKGLLPSSRK